jgi:hypothetical protein
MKPSLCVAWAFLTGNPARALQGESSRAIKESSTPAAKRLVVRMKRRLGSEIFRLARRRPGQKRLARRGQGDCALLQEF